jgi:hypothetical protein
VWWADQCHLYGDRHSSCRPGGQVALALRDHEGLTPLHVLVSNSSVPGGSSLASAVATLCRGPTVFVPAPPPEQQQQQRGRKGSRRRRAAARAESTGGEDETAGKHVCAAAVLHDDWNSKLRGQHSEAHPGWDGKVRGAFIKSHLFAVGGL